MEKKGLFVILRSDNGRDGWRPVRREEVPEWVLQPDVLGRLVNGDAACKCDEEEPAWYAALVQLDAQEGARVREAIMERERKQAESLLLSGPAGTPLVVEGEITIQ